MPRKIYRNNEYVPGTKIPLNNITTRAQKLIMKDYYEFKKRCRSYNEVALGVVVGIMTNKKSHDSDRLKASQTVLSYGYGTPRPVPVDPSENGMDDDRTIRVVVSGGLPNNVISPQHDYTPSSDIDEELDDNT